ncbi:hypothetical protein JCM14076_07640 [Methylosoma difficile]
MSDTIWINIRNGSEIDCNEDDHSAMLALTEELDILAAKLGVKPLSAFYDYTDFEMNMSEEDEDEDEEMDGEPWSNDQADWFAPEEAHASVTAILAAVQDDPDAIKTGRWDKDDLIWELEDTLVELDKAIEAEQPFHFCIVM